MPLLYHWRDVNYRSDLGGGIAWHLNQKSARLHAIDPGDSLWAFTRDREKRYVLAAELVVRAKTFNPPGYAYGPHRVWAEPARSRFFRVEGQRAIEPVIRALSLRPEATTLGQAMISVKTISPGKGAGAPPTQPLSAQTPPSAAQSVGSSA